jgi:glyoxylase-like metal-dependent hydrolase (beta-lactamase superfamily II)
MTVSKVAAGVWRAGSRYVNWYIVDGGAQGLTLVDAGLPAYGRRLDETLHDIGRSRADVRALVLTHGHIDHIGMAAELAGPGATVYLHPADSHLAAHPGSNRPQRSLLRYAHYPGMVAFVGHAVRHGALRPPPMPAAQPVADGSVLEVPGHPIVTHAPGHTDGSCVFEFPEHGVVFVGDLLCTVNPFSGRHADPQLQTRGSNKNSEQAMASLRRLERVRAPLLLPGHGMPWDDGIEAAVASAMTIGCR